MRNFKLLKTLTLAGLTVNKRKRRLILSLNLLSVGPIFIFLIFSIVFTKINKVLAAGNMASWIFQKNKQKFQNKFRFKLKE